MGYDYVVGKGFYLVYVIVDYLVCFDVGGFGGVCFFGVGYVVYGS